VNRLSQPSDAEKITAVTTEFLRNDDTNQTTKAASCLCQAQAELYLETAHNQQLTAPDTRIDGVTTPDARVEGVTVRGNVASARVTIGPGDTVTLYYREENGKWTICDDAIDQFTQQGSG
jgi:hypothetical protein